jgi:hypothetical protein
MTMMYPYFIPINLATVLSKRKKPLPAMKKRKKGEKNSVHKRRQA